MKRLSILTWLILIAGCAGSPIAISMKSPEELKIVPDEQLCAAYGSIYKNKKLKNELESRNLFTKKEWQAIEDHDVFVGMSKNAFFAARSNNLYLTDVSNMGDLGMCEVYKEVTPGLLFILNTHTKATIYVRDNQVVGYQTF